MCSAFPHLRFTSQSFSYFPTTARCSVISCTRNILFATVTVAISLLRFVVFHPCAGCCCCCFIGFTLCFFALCSRLTCLLVHTQTHTHTLCMGEYFPIVPCEIVLHWRFWRRLPNRLFASEAINHWIMCVCIGQCGPCILLAGRRHPYYELAEIYYSCDVLRSLGGSLKWW